MTCSLSKLIAFATVYKKMQKMEIRAVIKYFYFIGLTGTEIKSELDSTLGKFSSSNKIVRRGFSEFKKGRTSTIHERRNGCSSLETNLERMKKYLQNRYG